MAASSGSNTRAVLTHDVVAEYVGGSRQSRRGHGRRFHSTGGNASVGRTSRSLPRIWRQPAPHPFDLTGRLLRHADRLAQLQQTGDTFPVSLEVNLINRCNMACPWCIATYSRDQADPGIASDVLIRRLREAHRLGLRSVTWSGGGEPTCHPEFLKILAAVHEIGFDQGLMTNGLLAQRMAREIPRYCAWGRVSLDTHDPQAYAAMKSVSPRAHQRVVANIRSMVQAATRCRVGVNMNVANWNVDHIADTYALCADCGASYLQLRPVLAAPGCSPACSWPLGHRGIERLASMVDHIRRRTGTELRLSLDKFGDCAQASAARPYRSCRYHHFVCVVDSDCSLCVCMYRLKDERFIFGNLKEQTFQEIWHGAKRRRVLEHLTNMDFRGCQVCCKGHELNKILERLLRPDDGANFL